MTLEVKLPPPVPKQYTYGISVAKGLCGLGGWEAQSIPYVCAQVARCGRGEIGINDSGDLVFHLVIDNDDIRLMQGLITTEEIWVVLKPSPLLTDPYFERGIVL